MLARVYKAKQTESEVTVPHTVPVLRSTAPLCKRVDEHMLANQDLCFCPRFSERPSPTPSCTLASKASVKAAKPAWPPPSLRLRWHLHSRAAARPGAHVVQGLPRSGGALGWGLRPHPQADPRSWVVCSGAVCWSLVLSQHIYNAADASAADRQTCRRLQTQTSARLQTALP